MAVEINNIEYIINNTKILAEFTAITEQIRSIVLTLPNKEANQNLKEILKEVDLRDKRVGLWSFYGMEYKRDAALCQFRGDFHILYVFSASSE